MINGRGKFLFYQALSMTVIHITYKTVTDTLKWRNSREKKQVKRNVELWNDNSTQGKLFLVDEKESPQGSSSLNIIYILSILISTFWNGFHINFLCASFQVEQCSFGCGFVAFLHSLRHPLSSGRKVVWCSMSC